MPSRRTVGSPSRRPSELTSQLVEESLEIVDFLLNLLSIQTHANQTLGYELLVALLCASGCLSHDLQSNQLLSGPGCLGQEVGSVERV